jgi:Restriction endonuclease fold toxin 5
VKDGVRFDGFDYGTGSYIEVKGPGYADQDFYNADGSAKPWYTGHADMLKQLQDQYDDADGRPITWYVTNDFTAGIVRNAVSGLERVNNITVAVQPLVP